MAATIPNIAKGRINEFARRVDGNDPATSGFVVVLLTDVGLETLAVLRDYDTLAAILAGTNTESAVVTYARLVLTDAEVGAVVVDDAGDQQTFDVGDFDFGALEAGENIAASVISYAPDTAGIDSTLIPCHISIPTSAVATNGEIFNWRTPNGLWAAGE